MKEFKIGDKVLIKSAEPSSKLKNKAYKLPHKVLAYDDKYQEYLLRPIGAKSQLLDKMIHESMLTPYKKEYRNQRLDQLL